MATRMAPGVPLTPREAEVARLAAAEGLRSAQAAARLGVSPRTVEGHLRSAYVKTRTRNRVTLLLWLADHPPG
jgi:DNA-binding CsgD family transcriptional regulator